MCHLCHQVLKCGKLYKVTFVKRPQDESSKEDTPHPKLSIKREE